MAQVLIATYGIVKMPYGAIEGGVDAASGFDPTGRSVY